MAEKEYVLGNKVKDLLVYSFVVTKPIGDKTTEVGEIVKLLRTIASLQPDAGQKLIRDTSSAMEKADGKQGFPKSAVHTYIKTVRETAVSILKNIHAANECAFQTEHQRRIRLIHAALDDCNLLLKLVEISHELGYINLKRMAHWTKLITDVKYMSLAWKKKDTERAKEIAKQERVREYQLQGQIISEAIQHALRQPSVRK